MFNRKSLKREGFTVVELAVVIAIIGILAGITVVAYGGYRDQAYDAAVSSDLLMIGAELESYQNFNNRYPKNATELASIGIDVSEESYDAVKSGIALTYCTNYQRPTPSSSITPAFGVVGRSATGKIFYVSNQTGGTVEQVDAVTAESWTGNAAGVRCANYTGVKRFDPVVSAYFETSTGHNYFNDGDWAGFK